MAPSLCRLRSSKASNVAPMPTPTVVALSRPLVARSKRKRPANPLPRASAIGCLARGATVVVAIRPSTASPTSQQSTNSTRTPVKAMRVLVRTATASITPPAVANVMGTVKAGRRLRVSRAAPRQRRQVNPTACHICAFGKPGRGFPRMEGTPSFPAIRAPMATTSSHASDAAGVTVEPRSRNASDPPRSLLPKRTINVGIRDGDFSRNRLSESTFAISSMPAGPGRRHGSGATSRAPCGGRELVPLGHDTMRGQTQARLQSLPTSASLSAWGWVPPGLCRSAPNCMACARRVHRLGVVLAAVLQQGRDLDSSVWRGCRPA